MNAPIALIVLSYNRPRMLAEALDSVQRSGASQVIVVDDGSDFDVRSLVNHHDLPWCSFIIAPPMSVAERMVTPRTGSLINEALRHVEQPFVGYLCDDDLMAQDWLSTAALYMEAHPNEHMVKGRWMQFADGQSLETAVPCPFDDIGMTTGNFVHRTECATGEGCWWDVSTVSCHDAAFLTTYLRVHQSRAEDITDIGVLAGYRREHRHNMLAYITGQAAYTPEAASVLGGFLE